MKTCRKRGHEYEESLKCCPICAAAKKKEWNEKHREHNKEIRAKWVEKHRDELLRKKKEFHESHPEDGKKWYAILKKRKPLYNIWNSMIQRCHNPRNDNYSRYGARGIEVCERWRGEKGYENFEADMPPRPSVYHSIDRENNDLGYYKENCRWATRSEQQRNRRTNALVTIDGRTQCVEAWAKELGMKRSTFQMRIDLDWTGKELLKPVKKYKQRTQ